jgi:hypothetical protein
VFLKVIVICLPTLCVLALLFQCFNRIAHVHTDCCKGLARLVEGPATIAQKGKSKSYLDKLESIRQ